jgi:curved DNA-binding protein CbpA
MSGDHYQQLGVHHTASPEEIRRAYWQRARQLHPDVTGSTDDRAIKALNQAYAVLSNPARRRAYDQQLARQAASKKESTGEEKDWIDIFFALIDRWLDHLGDLSS